MLDLISICSHFQINERVAAVEPFGSGHINSTFRVFVDDEVEPRYVLQQVNTSVFPNVEGLSRNIRGVITHLQKDFNLLLMQPIVTIHGLDWLTLPNGSTWRVFTYIPSSISIDLVQTDTQAEEAGRAYGHFIHALRNFDSTTLCEVIPNFHSLSHRLNQLRLEIASNAAGRLASCSTEVDFYISRANDLLSFYALVGTPDVPYRVTHNDTKVNNVLFSAEGKALSVIDLDTVMQGVVHFDFGDSIRTIAATALEDETNLDLVGININLFASYTKGFASQTAATLTTTERDTLYLAPRLMAYIMGIRFLADFLRGDTYYKVKHSLHNLQRAQNQMALIADMENKEMLMRQVVQEQFAAVR